MNPAVLSKKRMTFIFCISFAIGSFIWLAMCPLRQNPKCKHMQYLLRQWLSSGQVSPCIQLLPFSATWVTKSIMKLKQLQGVPVNVDIHSGQMDETSGQIKLFPNIWSNCQYLKQTMTALNENHTRYNTLWEVRFVPAFFSFFFF